ncbi:MAG: hypothetical protein ABIG89_00010 [Candidatus Woesearchaeota archaeon]
MTVMTDAEVGRYRDSYIDSSVEDLGDSIGNLDVLDGFSEDSVTETEALFQDPDQVYLIGTPLEGIGLQDLLQNVEDNNLWNAEEEIDRIKAEVEIDYNTYVEVRKRALRAKLFDNKKIKIKDLIELSGYTQETLSRWKRGEAFSRIIKPYLKSFLPKTAKERQEFAYVLGYLSFYASTGEVYRDETVIDIDDTRVRKKIRVAVNNLTGRKTKGKGKNVKIYNNHFVRTVKHILRNEELLRRYVADDDERKSLLTGHFDNEKHNFHKSGSSKAFTVLSGSEGFSNVFQRSLFHLGVYVPIDFDGLYHIIIIRDIVNLRAMLDSGVIKGKGQREEVEAYINLKQRNKKPFTVQEYYRLRYEVERDYGSNKANRISEEQKTLKSSDEQQRVNNESVEVLVKNQKTKRRYRTGPTIPLEELAEKYGIGKRTFSHFVSDIAGYSCEKSVPVVVKNYIKVCEQIGIGNVYASGAPVRLDEKVFFPVNGEVFVMTPKMQERYFKAYGLGDEYDETFDDKYVAIFWHELKANFSDNGYKGREHDLNISLTGNNEIKNMSLIQVDMKYDIDMVHLN